MIAMVTSFGAGSRVCLGLLDFPGGVVFRGCVDTGGATSTLGAVGGSLIMTALAAMFGAMIKVVTTCVLSEGSCGFLG